MSSETLTLVDKEMAMARAAITEMNNGKARVCARRAVVLVIQERMKYNQPPWNSRLALEYISEGNKFPDEVITAGRRLQGGLRAQLSGEVYSENPIEDAEIIIRYFVDLP